MNVNGFEFTHDLGHDHWLKFTGWHPDRALNPQYADLPDIDPIGALVAHKRPDGSWCVSGIHFDSEQARRIEPAGHLWTVESLDPLTCNPSLLCKRCGDHGFIKDGRWIPA